MSSSEIFIVVMSKAALGGAKSRILSIQNKRDGMVATVDDEKAGKEAPDLPCFSLLFVHLSAS